MERKLMKIHLFNCDNTYNLDSVEVLLHKLEDDNLKVAVDKHYFRLQQMSEMCETINSGLQIDIAIFVVHAHESRLSINEDNAGIGYAKIYRALLNATDGRVLIVIGGDDQYRDKDEEERVVISRWARRKVASQFGEGYLDGRKSFIFSWNKKHREIHEEALMHYFDPSKKGHKFEYQPKPKPVPEEPKITSQPSRPRDTQKEFMGGMQENGTRQRGRLNDQQGQKSEIKIDLEKPSYSGGAYSIPSDHPEGTVLLDTNVRYGEISYKKEDVKVWDRSWQPSERAVQDLDREWKTVPLANVQFIVNANGGVVCNVFKVEFPNKGFYSWLKSMIAHSPGITICTGACLVGIVIFGVWRTLSWWQEEPNVYLKTNATLSKM